LHRGSREKRNKYDKCQMMGRPLRKDEMTLHLVHPSLPFKIYVIDFIGPFPKGGKSIGVGYIIIIVKYLNKWIEVEPVDTCTKEDETKFIYENIITIFGCPLTLINDQGTHFLNGTTNILKEEFLIDHSKNSPYHPQENGAIELT